MKNIPLIVVFLLLSLIVRADTGKQLYPEIRRVQHQESVLTDIEIYSQE